MRFGLPVQGERPMTARARREWHRQRISIELRAGAEYSPAHSHTPKPNRTGATRMASSKNIVLLSDGTGNSSAKLMKTNVWRMYEALDLTTGEQIACYDNGVGTSSFKPLAVLGGGLGWGLKRNVRHLYT